MDPTDDWGLSAVYPDGTLLLTNGQPTDSNQGAFGVLLEVDRNKRSSRR